jgi:chaperonin GroEL
MHHSCIQIGEQAREGILAGVNQLAEAVKVTYGPKGRVVMGEDGGKVWWSSEGGEVIKEFELPDRLHNLGAQIVQGLARRMTAAAGDGTATSILIAQALMNGGHRCLVGGLNPDGVRRGLLTAAAAATDALRRSALPSSEAGMLAKVAAGAAAGDQLIGDLVAAALQQADDPDVVRIEPARGSISTVERFDGFRFPGGYVESAFGRPVEAGVLEDTPVLVTDEVIADFHSLLPLLMQLADQSRRLLIVARDVDIAALNAVVGNHACGSLDVWLVRPAPDAEEVSTLLADVASFTSAELISESLGRSLTQVRLADLGHLVRAEIGAKTTTLHGPAALSTRQEDVLRSLRLELDREIDIGRRERLRQRIARLLGQVTVIRLTAVTETGFELKRRRAEQALKAIRLAREEGVVPGGGLALLRAAESLGALKSGELAFDAGVDLLAQALEQPLCQLAANAGYEGRPIVERLKGEAPSIGFDVDSGRDTDLVKAGVVDPVKLVRLSVECAVSVAALILSTEATLVGEQAIYRN